MKIKILTSDYVIKSFDCGDADLNDFLFFQDVLACHLKIMLSMIIFMPLFSVSIPLFFDMPFA